MSWDRNRNWGAFRIVIAALSAVGLSACAHKERAVEASAAPPAVEAEAEIHSAADVDAETPAVPESRGSIVVVQSSGEIRDRYPVGTKFRVTDRVTLRDGDNLIVLDSKGARVISGSGTFIVGARDARNARAFARLTRSNSRRGRTGAVRGGSSRIPTSTSNRTIIYRVSSASASAANRYPRGTRVYRGQNLCLRDNEQMTISATNGTRVTYDGPGCLRRAPNGSNENAGGFTFGLAVPIASPLAESAMAGE